MTDETTDFVIPEEAVEQLCEVMHDAYERAAVGAGWETQQASRKPWADVPEANKATMRVAVRALLAAARPHLRARQIEALEEGGNGKVAS
jgi:hypothetical protein